MHAIGTYNMFVKWMYLYIYKSWKVGTQGMYADERTSDA